MGIERQANMKPEGHTETRLELHDWIAEPHPALTGSMVKSNVTEAIDPEMFPVTLVRPSPPFALGATVAAVVDADYAQAIVTAVNSHAALQQANERMDSALNRIAEWCKAYPVENFREPDWEDVKRLLGAELLTQVSAANMRHVINGIAKIVSNALAETGGETGI